MLTLCIALPCEAQPFIQHYRLARDPRQYAFPLYRNAAQTIQCVISGIGQLAAASACGFAYAMSDKIEPLLTTNSWINIGVAGHADLSVGQTFLAHKIIDHASQQHWYPGMQIKTDLISDQLTTYDQPQSHYSDQGGVDMEAAGFMQTCLRFTPAECVHVIKVVSDNSEQTINTGNNKFNKKFVTDLMQVRCKAISQFIDDVIELEKEIQHYSTPNSAVNELADAITIKQHFTHSQKKQLIDSLNKISILSPEDFEQLKIGINITQPSKANEILMQLKVRLTQLPPCL